MRGQFKSPETPLMIGLHFAWHVFNEKTSGPAQHRRCRHKGQPSVVYINSFPMMLTGHWYTGSREEMQFFFGTGVGAYYIRQRFEIGVFAEDQNNWHFGIAPEVGVQFPFGDIDGTFSVRYDYAFKSGESVQGDGQAYSYLRFAVGVGVRNAGRFTPKNRQ